MKKNILLYIAAVAGLVLAGCNKDLVDPGTASNEMRVTADLGALTKVSYGTYGGDKKAFATGDQIAVYAWMGDAKAVPSWRVVNGVVNTLGEDGTWTPETQMLWKTVVDPHYFLGIAPVHKITDFTADPYTLDSSDWQKSDLLIAQILGDGILAASNPVPLEFKHAMARLDVKLSFRNQWTQVLPAKENTEALISGVTVTAKKAATVDYITETVTATGDPTNIYMCKLSNSSWSSLMVPQDGVTTITLNLSGNDAWWGGNKTHEFISTADIPLVSGKVTTVNLIVGRDQIEVGTISINDWTAGEAYSDGDAEEMDYGTFLRDPGVAVGYMIGSNGKAYARHIKLPHDVKVIGCVVDKDQYNMTVMRVADEPTPMSTSEASAFEENVGALYMDNLDETNSDYKWIIQAHNVYSSLGMSAEGIDNLNSLLNASGCDVLNSTRYYGSSDGYVFTPSHSWDESVGSSYMRAVFFCSLSK